MIIFGASNFRVFKANSKSMLHRTDKRFYRTDVILKSEAYKMIRSTMVSSTGYGWLSIDITNVAKNWLRFSNGLLTVELVVRPIRESLPSFNFITTTNTSRRALLVRIFRYTSKYVFYR